MDRSTQWCHRWWDKIGGGTGLCGLRSDHGGDYCIDMTTSQSKRTDQTNPSKWAEVMARRIA